MNGRELIIYIFENHLEDEVMFEDGIFIGFIPANKAAVKLGVGEATIKVWHEMGQLPGVIIGGELYIYPKSLDNMLKNRSERCGKTS